MLSGQVGGGARGVLRQKINVRTGRVYELWRSHGGSGPYRWHRAAPSSNRLGTLRNVGQDAWVSAGGLRYAGRDPQNLNRVQHVLRHADDIPGRVGRHGVFDVGRTGTLGGYG